MRPLSTTPPCQVIARRRARAVGLATIPAVVLGAVLTANPAFADTGDITSKSDLSAAFGSATGAGSSVTLTTNLDTDKGSYDRQVLGDGSKLTVDLAGHELDLDQIEVGAGSTLTITDSASGAGLDVGTKSGAARDVAVTLDAGADIRFAGVKATIKGNGAAGIATRSGDTSSVSLASGADVTSTGAASSIDLGLDGTDAKALIVGDKSTLHVPASNTLAARTGSSISNAGTIDLQGVLKGSVANTGTITQGAGSSVAGADVTGNAFLVSYSKDGATGEVPSPTLVLAKDLASVALDVAGPVSATGKYFVGWAIDGSSTPVTSATALKPLSADGQVVLHPILRTRIAPSSGALAIGTVGHSYTADVKASAGYNITSYALAEGSNLPAGLTLSRSGTISGSPIAATDGALSFRVVVTADQDVTKTETETFSITVGESAAITSGAGALDPTVQNSKYTTTVTADGTGPITFALAKDTVLPAGLTLDKSSGVISGTPTKSGTFTFSVKASSATYLGQVDGKDVADYTLVVQSVPSFTATKVKSAPVGTDYVGSVKATDVDSADAKTAVTYTLSDRGALPGDFALSSDGVLTGRAAVIADYSFKVTAKGVHGSTTQAYSLSVGAVPVITSAKSLPEVAVGAADYSQKLTATGTGVSFSSKDLPAGMALSSDGSGVLTGAPSASSTGLTDGVYSFTVTATNEYGSVDQVFMIKAGTKPLISTTSLPDVGVRQAYHGAVSFTSDGDATVTVTGLPTGLSYDAAKKEISGTTTKNGTFPVVIAVANHWGTTTAKALDLVVGTAPANFVASLPTMITGNKITQALGAQGAGEITYAITDGHLPAGVDLVGGTVTGTPTAAGAYTVTITATTKYGSTPKTYSGSSGAAPAFKAAGTVPTGYVGQTYAGKQLAIAGDGDAVFSLAPKSTLPAGITLSDSGLLSGTPTGAGGTFTVAVSTPFGEALSAPITVSVQKPASFVTSEFAPVVLESGKGVVDQVIKVTGDVAESGSITLAPKGDLPDGLFFDKGRSSLYGTVKKAGTIEVAFTATGVGAPAVHTFDLEVGAAPVVATTTLAGGKEGEAYSSALVLGAGDGDVTWTATGDLPAGVTLSEHGVLSGTPTAAGTSTFVVTAKSIFGSSTSEKLSLEVAAKPVVVVPTPDPVKTEPAPVKSEPAPVKTEPAPVKSEAPAPVKSETPAPVQTTAPAPVVVAPAPAPVLPALPGTVARFGHPLALSVAANSLTKVTYSVSAGDLPKGIELDATTGAISGTPAEAGVFMATIKATNAAGSSETKVSITVPKIVELVQATPAATTARIGKPVTFTISSLKKGEAYVVRVDGKVKLKGHAKKAGDLSVSVKLPRSIRDKVHTISVTGDRKVSDPAKRAKTAFTVSTITLRKTLTVKAAGTSVTVTRLAANETVKVTSSTGKVVAKGKADKSGVFTFSTKALGKGSHKLVAHGATDLRAGSTKVKVG